MLGTKVSFNEQNYRDWIMDKQPHEHLNVM